MQSPSPGTESRRRRLIVLAVLAIAVVSVVAAFAAINKGRTPSTPTAQIGDGGDAVVSVAPSPFREDGTLAPLKADSDPEAFSRSVAQALFEWDTSAGVALTDYIGRMLAVADPTGEESPGLVADISNYLPSPQIWSQLRPYSTRQWITVSSTEVPGLWSQALNEAPEGGLLPGTTAYTVTGVRHRSGVWEGKDVASEHDVEFTVFMVCAPAYPKCHLLRLSRLDEPLR